MHSKTIYLVFLSIFAFQVVSSAQTTDSEKKEKTVKIIKKTVNENGEVTVEERIYKGKEADNIDIEKIVDYENIDIQIDIDEEVQKMIESENDVKTIRIEKHLTDDSEEAQDMKEKSKKSKYTKEVIIEKEMDGNNEEMVLNKIKRKQKSGDSFLKNINMKVDSKTQLIEITYSAIDNTVAVLRALDSTGQKLIEEKTTNPIKEQSYKINTSNAAKGPIFITISQGEKVWSEVIEF